MKANNTFFVLIILSFAYVVIFAPNNFNWPQVNYGEISSFDSVAIKKEQQEKEKLIESNPQGIIFVGDVLLARHVETLMRRNSAEYPFVGLNFKDFSSSTLVMGNFEATVPLVHKQTKVNQVNFSVSPIYLDKIKDFGFTHFSLANNHSYDYGDAGLANTRLVLSEKSLNIFGTPNQEDAASITYLPVRDFSVGILALNIIFRDYDELIVRDLLAEAQSKSKFQIIYIHWGDEYIGVSNARQKAVAEELISFGADLIIGHHPHVTQEVGLINNVPVFYSLGNYIFDQYFSEAVQIGLLLDFDFRNEYPLINLHPVTSLDTWSQPRLMNSQEKSEFLRELASKSSGLLSESIKNGQIELNFGLQVQ